MAKYKHLALKDCCMSQSMLNKKLNFSSIANTIGKDPSTISKEVRAHITIKNKGTFNQNYNSCVHHFSCMKSHICTEFHSARKYKLCKRCSMCNAFVIFTKKKPVPGFQNLPICVTDVRNVVHILYKNTFTMLVMQTKNIWKLSPISR